MPGEKCIYMYNLITKDIQASTFVDYLQFNKVTNITQTTNTLDVVF